MNSSDNRIALISSDGYQSQLNTSDGKGFHWCTDVRDELPIKIRQSGPGSELPSTLIKMFMDATASGKDRPAMWIDR